MEWPYLVEAKIVSVASDTVRYQLDKTGKQIVSELVEERSYDNVKREMKTVSSFLMNRKGIDIGQCDVLVEAKLMLGQRFVIFLYFALFYIKCLVFISLHNSLEFYSILIRLELCNICLLYTSPSPRDKRQSRMPSSA